MKIKSQISDWLEMEAKVASALPQLSCKLLPCQVVRWRKKERINFSLLLNHWRVQEIKRIS